MTNVELFRGDCLDKLKELDEEYFKIAQDRITNTTNLFFDSETSLDQFFD